MWVSLAADVDEDKKVDMMKRQLCPLGSQVAWAEVPPRGPSHSTPPAGSRVWLKSPVHAHTPSAWPSLSWALASLPTSPSPSKPFLTQLLSSILLNSKFGWLPWWLRG